MTAALVFAMHAFFNNALLLLKSTIPANLSNTPVNAALYTVQTTTPSFTMLTLLTSFVWTGTAIDAVPYSTFMHTQTQAVCTATFNTSMLT